MEKSIRELKRKKQLWKNGLLKIFCLKFKTINALLFKNLIIALGFIYISTIDVLPDKGAQYNNSIIIEILKNFFKQNYVT